MPPHQIALRRRVAALVLALSVGIAAFLLWPARDAAPVRSPPLGGSSQGYAGPENYLAWVPGGFDDPSFRRKMERLAGLDEAVVVAGDTLWLRKTQDADGRVVDEPTRPFAFPIDVFAVEADDYAPFVGTSVRDRIVRALSAGRAVLGQHSARLRRLGPGGKLTFRTGSVRVGAVVPDDAVGWSEVLLDREVGRRLGITHERYLLAQTESGPHAPRLEAEALAVRRRRPAPSGPPREDAVRARRERREAADPREGSVRRVRGDAAIRPRLAHHRPGVGRAEHRHRRRCHCWARSPVTAS